MGGLEYDLSYDEPDDAMDRLKENFDKVQLEYGALYVEHKELRARYVSMYEALLSRVENEKARKVYLIDKYQKENNDIDTELLGLKQTKRRDLGEGE